MAATHHEHQSPVRRAVYHALRRNFGEGHFATTAAYRARFRDFERFVKNRGIRDPREFSRSLVDSYASSVQARFNAGKLALSTAINRLSSVNIVMRGIFGDDRFFILPRDILPTRSYVRMSKPGGQELSLVVDAYHYLVEAGQEEMGVFVVFMRTLGLRIKESILQDYVRMYAESETGWVHVVEGTKNGRGKYVARQIPIDPVIVPLLARAATLQGNRKNLIPEDTSYIRMLGRVRYQYSKIRNRFALRRPHDLRAAYACDRYESITGFEAPVIAGRRLATKESDREARFTISREMGHGRPNVCVSYLGSAR